MRMRDTFGYPYCFPWQIMSEWNEENFIIFLEKFGTIE